MFEVGVVGHFEAAHRLRGDFGPARRLHGHTYKVEVAVRGEAIEADNVLYDVGKLQEALSRALAPLHYRDLDEVEGFGGRNTTAETVAQYLHEQVGSRLDPRPDSIRVTVWESDSVYASYEAALNR
ncbi:MAG TPA: 6-carboxytetrahydropterin synthase [Chloroflexota bacterium]|nr:6-carboxytetrahydropterin synthase [Chloroflexota bacterium]